MQDKVYGVVVGGLLHSGRMERKLRSRLPNGVYCIDMESDDIEDGMSPADIADASRYFKKASRTGVVRGVSFHAGMIPENPVSYRILPVPVVDPTCDDLEEIEAVHLGNGTFYYLQNVETPRAYVLMDLKERFASKLSASDIKGVTPEMRIAFSLLSMERQQKEELDPINSIKLSMVSSGAEVILVKKSNRGYEVTWKFDNNVINTLLDKSFRVVEAGFCVSGYDRTQTARSVVNVLKDYVKEGSYIHKTRTIE